jgi:hypothetical protein
MHERKDREKVKQRRDFEYALLDVAPELDLGPSLL